MVDHSWIVKNWYLFYLPIHLILGLLGWAWFNYGITKSIEEKSNKTITEQLLPLGFLCLVYTVSFIMGPIALLTTTCFYFFHTDGLKLKWGLKFF